MPTNAVETFSQLGLTAQPQNKKKELGQDDFLRLMVTQLKAQNPLKPLENTEFLGQLAQFSVVDGIQGMQQSFVQLSESLQANQALQGAALLGHSALAPGGTGELAESGGISGAIELPASSAGVTIEVLSAGGQVVRTLSLGPRPEGLSEFSWDGVDAYGSRAAPGSYTLRARAEQNGRSVAANTLVAARVQTVTLGGASGLVLNLAGLGPVALSQVRQIL